MSEVKKQAVTGFKIIKYDSRKARETEKLRIILEAEVDGVGVGAHNIGELLGALQYHQSGDTDVGFSLFMSSKENTDVK